MIWNGRTVHEKDGAITISMQRLINIASKDDSWAKTTRRVGNWRVVVAKCGTEHVFDTLARIKCTRTHLIPWCFGFFMCLWSKIAFLHFLGDPQTQTEALLGKMLFCLFILTLELVRFFLLSRFDVERGFMYDNTMSTMSFPRYIRWRDVF